MTNDELSSDLVRAAQMLATRFADGGRLVACGEGRALFDARHVAVEFLHPVIVGKRALPALVGSTRLSADDIVLSIGYDTSALVPDVDIAITDRALPSNARANAHQLCLPAGDAALAKRVAVVAYHTLWELTHAFLDASQAAPTTGPADAAVSSLYPMLDDKHSRDGTDMFDAAVASTAMKLADIDALRQRTIEQNDRAIDRAAELLAGAARVYTFGNGGSSTDAADLAFIVGERAHALSNDATTITALANDVGFDVVFARPLASLGRPGDLAVALSTSGSSPNLLAAFAESKRRQMTTIGIAGYDGGAMARSPDIDVLLVVRSDSVHRIQEAQVSLYCEIVRRADLARRRPLPARS